MEQCYIASFYNHLDLSYCNIESRKCFQCYDEKISMVIDKKHFVAALI